jgi:Fe-S-cluster containining protein
MVDFEMEIQIDVPTVRGILTEEHDVAAAQIQEAGPLRAVALSQARHDERLAAAGDASTLACKAGCFWCCYFSVDVRPVEVFRILQFMEQALTAEDRARIRQQISSNQRQLANVDRDTRARLNVRCPFLDQGRCSIYTVRPQTCRNYHATNVAGCQRSYEHPEDLGIDPEFAPLTYQIGMAHVDGFSKAMAAAGYDHRAYEMNAALAHALEAPESARQRFASKQPPFGEVEGEPVPLEFEEL